MKIGDKSLQWIVAVAVVQAFLVGLLFLGEATGVTNLLSTTETRIVCPGATVIEGATGEQGAQGETGPQGEPGPSGPPGPTGAPGEQGPQGEQGEEGAPGKQGKPGATGTPGPTGSVGPQGETGATGPAGATGATGLQGVPGETGAPGITGAPGATGATGPQGEKGDQGDPGVCPSYHGSYYDTTTQTATPNTPTPMKLNSTISELGISVQGGTRITVAQSGVYNIEFSAQLLQDTLNQSDSVDIWLEINGSPMPNSNTTVYLEKNQARYVAAWNFMVRLEAGDYAELMWYTTTGGVQVLYVAEAPPRPAIPSLILTIDQVASP